MPRIDPLQLLKCLSVLLSPDGGILSRDEVPRLVNLMTKFSKKLVSKCVYVLILKNTETSLVDMFMAEGGWALIQNWLQDAVQTGNWDLVKEILGLLLITPVDVERLKMNCLPKVIKSLSRREDLAEVADISNQIVQNWLSIVKGCSGMPVSNGPAPVPPTQPENRVVVKEGDSNEKPEKTGASVTDSAVSVPVEERNGEQDKSSTENVVDPIAATTFYKMSIKDGKQVIKKLSVEEGKDASEDDSSSKSDDSKTKTGEKDSKSNDLKTSAKSGSSSSRSKSSSSSRDKDRARKSSSKSSSSSKSKSSSTSSSRDKDRKDRDKDRDRKDRSKHSSSSSSRSSSKSSSSKGKSDSKDKSKEPKEIKENQADKDKDTLEMLKPQTLDRLGRIPKKSSGSSDDKQKENKPNDESDKKKPSFSILNRKVAGEERSKTVKVFNAKMRSTGLEEEVKPPPPRSATKKPNPSVQLPTIPPKRPSPPRDLSSSIPPEKKLKIDKVDIPERPGAIKLIPPKPKPAILQESDMFMDALTAAAPKKDTKKRKRRVSVTKETVPSSPSASPAQGDGQATGSPTPSSPTIGLKNMAPINFYQDTLSEETEATDDNKNEPADGDVAENGAEPSETNETPSSPTTAVDAEPMDVDVAPSPARQVRLDGGLKGVLLYSKKKGPKRSIKWKAEDDLVEVRYFELDENERVNVTKTFMDMAKMEMTSEREALIMSRKLPNEDTMEPQTMWRMLYICEQPESLAIPGSKSLEKDIQFAREKTSLPALYFDKRRIPDSAEEPIPEIHQMSDPVIIPLEDPESQEIDLRNTPWPEPKGPSPQLEPQIVPPMFQNMPFNPNFNNIGNMPPGAPFMGVPQRFPGPPGPMGPVPGNFVPPNMMHNNMMVPPMNQPDMMNSGPPGPMNQGMFGPGGMMKPGPDAFIGHGNAMPPFNGPPGPMFGQNNFNRGRGGFRRGGGNNGGWVQLNGPRSWKRGNAGGGRGGGRMCKNIQNHGYCRNGDSCPFVH